MKVKCIRTIIPFYEKDHVYEISREFIGNVGESKGINYTEIRINHDMAKRVETDDLDSGNSDFIRID